MGKTYSKGNNHNKQWLLGNDLGNGFENGIYKYILYLCKDNLNVEISQTTAVNDGGKDIILQFSGNSLNLFGITFEGLDYEKTTVYIECKSTDDNKLRREKYIPAIENIVHDICKVNYFVLLTNAAILAKDHYYAKEILVKRNIKFVLIDQYIIARQLMIVPFSIFSDAPCYKRKDYFYMEYQTYTIEALKDTLNIFFVFRNYSSEKKTYSLCLLTNINWIVDSYENHIVVDSFGSYACKITLKFEQESDYHDINFSVNDGNTNHSIVIFNNRFSSYIPSFIGEQHHQAVDTIASYLHSEIPNRLFCLWGDAGVGKTRITSELTKIISKSNFDVFHCMLKKNNQSSVNEICSFLKKKGYIGSKDISKNIKDFKDMILSCKDIIKIAVIIIDDFHNSSEQFIDQMKKLKSHSASVVIILCGRTDYSAGNTYYYSFVEWSDKNLIHNESFWNIKPLKEEDAKNLIRCSIQNMPERVYNAILENSQNNPLYIAQYAESLLDQNIAYIASENTISIYNLYKSKLIDFLPKGINDIYEKRMQFVKKAGNDHKINYVMFMLIMIMYNGQISENDAREFDLNESKVNFLQERRFIEKNNNTYIFKHESIRIFFTEKLMHDNRLQKKLGNIMLAQKSKVSDYPKLMKARLYYWVGKHDLALQEYGTIISAVSGENNISNISVETSFYEYIDDILDIIRNDAKYTNTANKLITTKIYISLHHFIPINAVSDCNKCLKYISEVPFLKKDNRLINSIYAQKAHSLMNAGMNFEGILLLNELQAKLLMNKENFNYQSVFDIVDRLCAIYIKFNCFDIALEYSNIAIKIAEGNNDVALLAIAYRTRSKLFYLKNYEECQKSLNMVDICLQKSQSDRIKLNNRIYRKIVDLPIVDLTKDNKFIDETEQMAQEAWDKHLNRAYIQSNLLLSAIYLRRGKTSDLHIAEQKAQTAVDYSARFGIPGYLWQLYNILAIIDIRLCKSQKDVSHDFEYVYNILRSQNLLFIGKKDLCYSNVLAISNIAYYLRHNFTQKQFNSRMSLVTFYNEGYTNNNYVNIPIQANIEEKELAQLYKLTQTKQPEILFCNNENQFLLRDDISGYFIALT